MTDERSVGVPPAIQPQGGLSNETRALMLYVANKKSAVVAYLLWFFLGLAGAHNFYLKRTGVAVAQLVLTITIVGSVITLVWVFVDAFLIPGWVRRLNNQLAVQLGA
jgi:TM2 domain-containing membrane protein YozV